MLIPAVWQVLIEAGIGLVPLDAKHVELRHGGRTERLLLKTFSRPLNPSDVAETVDRHREPCLLILPVATSEVRRTIERAGWSWLVRAPGGVHGVLRFGDEVVKVGEQGSHADVGQRGRPGRVPWGTLTLVRRLLQQPATTQRALAELAHVSQPRVSQTLRALAEQQLVGRGSSGWLVRDFDGLLRMWLNLYPGPGGISTYWYGLDSPLDQAQAAVQLLATNVDSGAGERRSGEGPVAVVSGDVAADLVAPWRSPTRAVIYTHNGADLTTVGLIPTDMDEATLELIVPEDPGVWPTAPSRISDVRAPEPGTNGELHLPIADLLQVLWDVRRTPGSDSGEATTRLWETLREHNRCA